MTSTQNDSLQLMFADGLDELKSSTPIFGSRTLGYVPTEISLESKYHLFRSALLEL